MPGGESWASCEPGFPSEREPGHPESAGCARLEAGEEVDEGLVVFLGGDGKGGFALEVHGGEVCAFFDEELADLDVAFDGGEHEQGPAFVVGGVGGKARVECGAKARFVAALDEVLCASVVHGCSEAVCRWCLSYARLSLMSGDAR